MHALKIFLGSSPLQIPPDLPNFFEVSADECLANTDLLKSVNADRTFTQREQYYVQADTLQEAEAICDSYAPCMSILFSKLSK